VERQEETAEREPNPTVNRQTAREVPVRASLIALIERRYDAIVADGLAFHAAQAPPAIAAKTRRRGDADHRHDASATTCCCG
jgi:hypothetical protein